MNARYIYGRFGVFHKMVDTRCDNAGNYKNAAFIQGFPSVSKKTGVLIKTLNTSEPGYGKVTHISTITYS